MSCSRLFVLFVLVVALISAATVAYAADPQGTDTSKSASNSEMSWTRPYIGLNFGYAVGRTSTRFDPLPDAATFINLAPTTLHPDPKGVVGGGQIGIGHQLGSWVLGVEADWSGSGMSESKTLTPIPQDDGTPYPGTGFLTTHQDIRWFGTVRPRLGFLVTPRWLVYGTGGAAYGTVRYSANSDFRPFGTIQYPISITMQKVGWTAGGGVEHALTKRWSVKAEYLYVDLGREEQRAGPVPANPPYGLEYTFHANAHVVRAGLNLAF